MKFKQKLLSVALAMGLITGSTFVSLADTQQLEVHHINVGQGEAIYIEFPDGTDALIDAGKSNYGDTVVNYLKSQESNIDLEYLIATHPDADHIGGMQSVFKDLNVKNFIYPKDTQNNSNTWQTVLSLANKEGCTINDSTPGSTFDIGGVAMKFVQSPKDFTDNNDDSVVTYLDYKNTKFLFTGDIEAEAENDMVSIESVPDVDFMSVPHHGSRGSSTQTFLNKAKPEYAVVSVGENSYGHPTQDALNRYANIGTKVYRTDIDGNVVIKTDGISNTINKSNASFDFNDIRGHWGESQIKAFINKGYINGYPDGTFRPNNSITRAEFVTIFNNQFGLTNRSGKVFNDTAYHWAKDAIDIAVTNGVCNGMSNTEFGPDQPITREQAAKMVANYKGIKDSYYDRVGGYKDGWNTSNWAIAEVEAILEAGYMNGYSEDNTFRPKNNITRAEAVSTLTRVENNPNPVMPIPPANTDPTPPPVVERTVYANGGSSSSNKYHKSSNAHGMKGAIPMSESQARSKGYIPCGSCFK
ncbi:S-layer homology domain-containing protein [Paraclostridium ghonii]|uniref:S-layer homology domain-containing protein n=1 Tax=Paraclostridium ghonii TaxID=29358 RepID=UPI00202CF8F4|nr:S-layer homology domain-containing protein [Paeniclostridium ghonii]MCM0165929.1 S-layer homology domain-containing protein [Paeniclostridium ghonii]